MHKSTTSPSTRAQHYDALGYDYCFDTVTTNEGKVCTMVDDGFQNGVKEIHRFVEKVGSCNTVPFGIHHQDGRWKVTPSKDLRYIPASSFITQAFQDAHDLSEEVKVFLACEREVGLHLELDKNFLSPSLTRPGMPVAAVYNGLVRCIRDKLRGAEYRRRRFLRVYQAKENNTRGKHLIDSLFERYARLNVIRLDLSYQREHRPDLKRAKRDFARLMNNRRCNKIFAQVVGIIWRLEYSRRTGLHYHVMLFADGSHIRGDALLGLAIGNYWTRVITHGHGRVFNCNLSKNKYKRLGIGMISHHDAEKRRILVDDVLTYLTQADLLMRPHLPEGTKTFDATRPPLPPSGLGRKRSSAGA